MKAARIVAPNEPLQLTDIEIPKPGDLQAVVKVKSAGVCHSDLHLWEGGYDLG
ncbi:MAG: alcohol dehydrogenase catalytic domain-containing protein, partial [Thermoproteota archaeon]